MDIERTLLVESHARFALVASLPVLFGVQAVDGLSEDAGTSGLSYASRTAEQIRVRQFVVGDGILQCGSERLLTDHGIESRRTVFAG
jgi:hypothetical protein